MKNTSRYSLNLNDNQLIYLQEVLVNNLYDFIRDCNNNPTLNALMNSDEAKDLLKKIRRL